MTTLEVSVSDRATAFVAGVQHFNNYGEELVEVRAITDDELVVCDDDRFVAPDGEEWDRFDLLLRTHRVVVLLGDVGTGRHTAALRQLLDCSPREALHELEPTWARPQRRLLPPAEVGHGYVLDLSNATEEPAEEFGKGLRSWVRENEAFLVVLVTGRVWAGPWTQHLQHLLVPLPSPDARDLVERQLDAFGLDDRVHLLDEEPLAKIFDSSPRAEDAARLAEIIRKSTSLKAEDIADEYSGWETWLEKKFPRPLGTRTLLWSAALCDGGRTLSILQMSEALRVKLGENRGPAAVLADTITSKRLEEAHIVRRGDRAYLAPNHHGLAVAARRHLWDEFQLYRQLLTEWSVQQAAELPPDDAARVIDALLDLALHFRDGEIIKRLRRVLLANNRSFLAQALSNAAIDPRFGPYIRARLYTWLTNNPPQQLVELVAEVCGGVFGEKEPAMALVRLQRAALKTKDVDNEILAKAFTSLAGKHRQIVFDTVIGGWLDKPATERAGIVAVMGLASTDDGITALCGPHGADISDPRDRFGLVATFRRALEREDTREAAGRVLGTWKGVAARGLLPEDLVIEVLGASLAPTLEDNIMQRYLENGALDVTTFWGKVFVKAAQCLAQ
ncbi:hypothetical protein ABZ260_44135 [Streptosporangium sp. NPDC006013]|uniref:hypothetical protein n=1 Tax=Streptosporangium sp. NPDC006013 TaxID=3155596 RepID=UPI0033B93953